ncbi:hypothetical protein QFZ23_000328 [Arthrobacter globiformis]|nr:hypothetical protein [Arthrobacter globiformis]
MELQVERVVLADPTMSFVEAPDQYAAPPVETLFAEICSPLPEPPSTIPRASTPEAWSATTAAA